MQMPRSDPNFRLNHQPNAGNDYIWSAAHQDFNWDKGLGAEHHWIGLNEGGFVVHKRNQGVG